MIDFSTLPVRGPSSSVGRNVLLAIGMLTGILLVMAGLAFLPSAQKETWAAGIVGVALLVFFIFCFVGVPFILRHKLRRNDATMRQFAQDNSWQYEGRQKLTDKNLFPIEFSYRYLWPFLRYKIKGEVNGVTFSLYLVQFWLSGHIFSGGSYIKPDYFTVIRLAKGNTTLLSGSKDFLVTNKDEHTLVFSEENVMNIPRMQALFTAAKLLQ